MPSDTEDLLRSINRHLSEIKSHTRAMNWAVQFVAVAVVAGLLLLGAFWLS